MPPMIPPNLAKRKTPSQSKTASPAPAGSGFRHPTFGSASVKREAGAGPSTVRVKQESGGEDVKRRRLDGPVAQMASYGHFQDPRTTAIAIGQMIKREGTLNQQTARFFIEEQAPGSDPFQVLEHLKGDERIKYNEVNQVYTWVPELLITNETQLRAHIRSHATLEKPLLIKDLREAIPPPSMPLLEDLERKGDIIIMRQLTGSFKDVPLPPLGRPNAHGYRINENGISGNSRWKTVWWDEMKERGRSHPRAAVEFIAAWADVHIADTDDAAKLLEAHDLPANVAPPPLSKVLAGMGKKKKRAPRAIKITNTHMKDLNIDFSKDYEKPA